MKREFTYIENYKGVKIYQYDENKEYTATPYIYSIEKKDLKELKLKIDETINDYIKKYRSLD